METGSIIQSLRKERDWSQGELASESGMSREMISKYECDEAAKKLARALGVIHDYLGGETDEHAFDRKPPERLKDITVMPEDDRKRAFLFVDALIRDFKAKKAYAQ